MDSTNAIVSANDYDAWGYPLENRSYEPAGSQKYQFTGMERDKESGMGNNDGYDYFGARYYDNRIGRWGQVEPLYNSYMQFTPYNYSLCNPIVLIDGDGLSPRDRSMVLPYGDGGALDLTANNVSIGSPVTGTAVKEVVIGIVRLVTTAVSLIQFKKDVEKRVAQINEEQRLRYEYENEVYKTEEINIFSNDIYIPAKNKIPTNEINPPKERGRAPTSKETGKPIEIHHDGQKRGGPYEERHRHDHRTDGSFKKYHDPKKKVDREKNWTTLVRRYWEKEWDSGRFNK